MKEIVCKRCGATHECTRMSNAERARLGGSARREFAGKDEKLAVARTALAEAPRPRLPRTAKSLVPAAPRVPSVQPAPIVQAILRGTSLGVAWQSIADDTETAQERAQRLFIEKMEGKRR